VRSTGGFDTRPALWPPGPRRANGETDPRLCRGGTLMNLSGSRTKVFWIQILYLSVLAGIAWAYFAGSLPGWLGKTQGSALSVQPGVLFFGAVGGVLLSLEGVFQHRNDWDETYFLWHVARPMVGALVGVIAVLIFLAGVLAVGAQGAAGTGATTGDKDLLYYVVAFVVGYREETFRGLIKRAADLIFTSPAATPSPVISAIDKDHGPTDGGDEVKISGSGLAATTSVQFGSAVATKFSVISDTEVRATTPKVDLPCRVSVLLVTPNGSAAAPRPYEYQPAPTPPTPPGASSATPTPPAASSATPTPPAAARPASP
jgi:hypothetical protein